ncbi:NUDIX hydrolase [Methylobacterium sp. J-048]|uniref:NUDIX hydrolase n=1 Tax=Methylobacterium sp. J-048 TaxID=2836635 RepID=UPI001FBBBE4B|nr:NUDIX hydrolase [Methylobacterium sp. J-048]MCJ2055469.1 NUDIX hydrolase [Methylobacterium sp. J-048]
MRIDIWDGRPFTGAKIALVLGDEILVYRRDDRPDIPFPGLWDLPGGGRENEESPADCALRETHEECGLNIEPERIVWQRRYPSWSGTGASAYFCAAPLLLVEVERIQFGSEGTAWRLMSAVRFIAHPRAVPHLQDRVSDYLRVAKNTIENSSW